MEEMEAVPLTKLQNYTNVNICRIKTEALQEVCELVSRLFLALQTLDVKKIMSFIAKNYFLYFLKKKVR